MCGEDSKNKQRIQCVEKIRRKYTDIGIIRAKILTIKEKKHVLQLDVFRINVYVRILVMCYVDELLNVK